MQLFTSGGANERHALTQPRFGACSLLAIAAMFGASPALAQTGDEFDGFRIEAITGYDNEGVDFDDDVFDGGKNDQSGWMYGVGVGYDFQMDAYVFGAEAEWSDSTASREDQLTGLRPTNPIVGAPTPVTGELDSKSGADIYLGLRAGYVVTPQALIYVKGGLSRHRIEIDGEGLDNGVPYEFDESVKVGGFRLGIGGEYLFSEQLYAKAEYRYTNYNNGDLDVRGADVDLDPLFHDVDVVRHQAAVGVGLRF